MHSTQTAEELLPQVYAELRQLATQIGRTPMEGALHPRPMNLRRTTELRISSAMIPTTALTSSGAILNRQVVLVLGVGIGIAYYKATIAKLHSIIFRARTAGVVITVGALLLVNTCLAASGLEVKQEAKAQASLESLTAALDSTNAATRFYAARALEKSAGSETIAPLAGDVGFPLSNSISFPLTL